MAVENFFTENGFLTPQAKTYVQDNLKLHQLLELCQNEQDLTMMQAAILKFINDTFSNIKQFKK